MKHTEMTHPLQWISFIALFLCLQPWVYGQGIEKAQYLQKIGITDSLYSKVLKEDRKIYVQLPEAYQENKKYPVVFILDGEVLLPTVAAVQHFYTGGFMPQMILVGISNATNRTRDLTTSNITEKYGMPFKVENGAAANFSTFIAEELIPYIEKKYPVTGFRTLIGHSYGGLFTIYTLLHTPQLFSNYIAIDPSLDWDQQQLIAHAQKKLAQNNYKGKSLFMSLSGQLHMQNPEITIDNVMQDTSDYTVFPRSIISFSNMVQQHKENELSFQWKFYPRDLHGTVPFPSIMDGLLFDFEWYQMEHTNKFNTPTTTKEELAEVVTYRAKKLESYFNYTVPPYPEDLLTVLGYMSMDMEQMEKAKMFFEFALEFYPNSPNVYDAMADYYERHTDYKKALLWVSKAAKLSDDAYYKERIQTLNEKVNKG